MFGKNKKITLKRMTNLASESAREAIEIAVQDRIRFHQTDITILRKVKVDILDKDPYSLTNQDVYFRGTLGLKQDSSGPELNFEVKVEIQGREEGCWWIVRILLKIDENKFTAWPTKDGPLRPDINFAPSFVVKPSTLDLKITI